MFQRDPYIFSSSLAASITSKHTADFLQAGSFFFFCKGIIVYANSVLPHVPLPISDLSVQPKLPLTIKTVMHDGMLEIYMYLKKKRLLKQATSTNLFPHASNPPYLMRTHTTQITFASRKIRHGICVLLSSARWGRTCCRCWQ